MMRGLGIQRKQERPNKSLIRSADALHLSLTPGFSQVPEESHAKSRLNGFRQRDGVITGVNSGVNERFSVRIESNEST